jgi:hypothetical protein
MLGAMASSVAEEPPGLTPSDRDNPRRYARDTWHSLATMTWPLSLPADELEIGRDGRARKSDRTSPTDIAS